MWLAVWFLPPFTLLPHFIYCIYCTNVKKGRDCTTGYFHVAETGFFFISGFVS